MNPEEKQPVVFSVDNQNNGDIPLDPGTPAPHKKGISILIILPVIIFILAGLGIGSYFLFRPRKDPEIISEKPLVKVVLPTPTPAVFFLTLESPADKSMIYQKKISVKGKTLPGSTLAVFTEIDAQTAEANADGYFQTEIELAEGINTISVTGISDSGEEKNIIFDVVYDI